MKHLRFIIGVVLVSFCGHLSYSQMVGVSFEVDTIFGEGAVDSWGESLEGYVTFDLFAELTNQEDQLSAVYSDVVVLNTPELYVEAPCGCYNPALGDVLVGGSQNELLFEFFPSIEYDTYWTLGFAEGEQAVLSNANYNSLSMCSETESGGLIFTITPVQAGDDLRVQFAQITTCGPFEVSACFQVFVNGVNAPYQEFCLETDGGGNLVVQSPFLGCTETTACNYDPSAFEDDGSCVPSGCLDPDAANYNPDAGCDSGDCVYGGADNCGPGTYWDVDELKCLLNPLICGEGTYWNQLLLQCLPFDNCPEDLDNDGQVAVSDLLLLLAAYSEICPLIQGCTDSNALNYNPNAEEDDGSCVFEIFGCTDEAACNFQPLANTDDGSCQEFDLCGICGGQGPQIGYDCDGECLNDEDGDGVCDEFEVFGCTNEEADNFDIDATEDDGSCLISGCTAPVACNYNPEADVDDGSCLAFDQCGVCGGSGFPDGTCDCEGALPEEGYDCFGICLNDEDGDGVCDEFEIPGCDSVGACNFDSEATEDDGTCDFPDEGYDCSGVCLIDSDGDGICDLFEIVGCQDDSACNFAEEATDSGECFEFDECGECGGDGIIDGACDCEGNFPATGYDCNGDCLIDSDGDGICDEYEIEGCIFSDACNYDEAATDDDGSCFFYCPGCTDSAACNYDFDALQDDGTCQYPIDLYGASNVDCEGNCLSDEDGDGVCLEDEVFGCTDEIACNYSVDNTEEDDSCEYSSCAGCFDITACNYAPTATIEDDESCEYETCAGCMYEFACNYDPFATIADNESCEFGTCPGCTDFDACNYNPTVTEDDGSCDFYTCLGCTIQSACNYSESAFVDDGSCQFSNLDTLGQTLLGNPSEYVPYPWYPVGLNFGRYVALSGDGTNLAVGSPNAGLNGEYLVGNVKVYSLDDGQWQQRGEAIWGDGQLYQAGGESGRTDFSNDGNTLAVAQDCCNGQTSPYYEIYKWIDDAWVHTGTFNEIGFVSGQPWIRLNAIGSRVAFKSADHVMSVYNYIDSSWVLESHLELNPADGLSCNFMEMDAEGDFVSCKCHDYDFAPKCENQPRQLGFNMFFGRNETGEWVEMNSSNLGNHLVHGIGTGAQVEAIIGEAPTVFFRDEEHLYSAQFSPDGWVVLEPDIPITSMNWADINNYGLEISKNGQVMVSRHPDSGEIRITEKEGDAWKSLMLDYTDAPTSFGDRFSLSANGETIVVSSQADQTGLVQVFSRSCSDDALMTVCDNPDACNYLDISGNCEFPEDFYGSVYLNCDGLCLTDLDSNGVCDEEQVEGCTDGSACNFIIGAVVDDGSCEYVSCIGCLDVTACNYCPGCSIQDDSCEFQSCIGCMDAAACNFSPNASIAANGICEYGTDINGDGVCDNEQIHGCVIENACNYNSLAQVDDGSCAFEVCDCMSVLEFEGYTYQIGPINNQCWFLDNLQVIVYQNGDTIPHNLSNEDWSAIEDGVPYGAFATPFGIDLDSVLCSNCSHSLIRSQYGLLYNWYAVDDERGLCPSGWHVSTDADWNIMENFLAGSAALFESSVGFMVRSDEDDTPCWDGTNDSGLSLLPAGYRGSSGSYGGSSSTHFWTSSSDYAGGAWDRRIYQDSDAINRFHYTNLLLGASIRCIKD